MIAWMYKILAKAGWNSNWLENHQQNETKRMDKCRLARKSPKLHHKVIRVGFLSLIVDSDQASRFDSCHKHQESIPITK